MRSVAVIGSLLLLLAVTNCLNIRPADFQKSHERAGEIYRSIAAKAGLRQSRNAVAPSPVHVPLQPVLEQVVCTNHACSHVNVTFGVKNCNGAIITIADGSSNSFTGLPHGSAQPPTVFQPGYNQAIITLTVTHGSSVSWEITSAGKTEKAEASNAHDGQGVAYNAVFVPEAYSLCTQKCAVNQSSSYTPLAVGQTQTIVNYAPYCVCGCVPTADRTALWIAGNRLTSMGGTSAQYAAFAGYKQVIVTTRSYSPYFPYGVDPAIASLSNVWIYPISVDVTDRSSVDSLFQNLAAGNPFFNIPKVPKIHVLVIVPGEATVGLVGQTNGEVYEEVLATNTIGHQTVAHAFVTYYNKWATEANGVHIIAFSSIAALVTSPGLTQYGATKAAVLSWGLGWNTERDLIALNGTTPTYPHVTIVMPTTVNTTFMCGRFRPSDCGTSDKLVAAEASSGCAGLSGFGVPRINIAQAIYRIASIPPTNANLADSYLMGDWNLFIDLDYTILPLNLLYSQGPAAMRAYIASITNEFASGSLTSYYNRVCYSESTTVTYS